MKKINFLIFWLQVSELTFRGSCAEKCKGSCLWFGLHPRIATMHVDKLSAISGARPRQASVSGYKLDVVNANENYNGGRVSIVC